MNDLLPVEAPGISPAAAPASARSGLRADAVDGLSFAAVVEAEADRARGEDKQENPDGLPELAAAQAMWMTLPLPAVSEAAPEAAPEAETGTPEAGPAAIAAEEAAPRLARGDWGYTVRLLDRVVSAAADGRAPAALAHRPPLWEEAVPVGAPVTTAGTSSGISTGISSGISTGTPAEAADEAALSAAPDIEAALADLLGPVAGDGWDGVIPPGPQAQWFRPVRAGRTADAAGDVRVTAGEAALSGAAAA
ncbi:MAG: hypothetical protein LBH86_04420, partial [Oscillospiraceae bacterium]|nr:hypothetical protein [Oscillospiraceae bacterium]